MRKMSKAAKAEAYDALRAENATLSEIVWHTFNGHAPDATEIVERDDGDTYKFQLYGALRANGGTLVKVFCSPGQSDSVEVFRFDDWLQTMATWPYGEFYTECKIAADKLRMKRNDLYEKEKQPPMACGACARIGTNDFSVPAHSPSCKQA